MSKKLCLLLVGLLSCLILQAQAQAQKVKLVTLEWEPYVGKSLSDDGFTAEIIREAFKRSGYEVELSFVPWPRALAMVESGKADGCFPSYWSDERAETYLFTEKIASGSVVLFKKADKNVSFNTLKDLKPYKIGVVRGYVNSPEFDAADYLKKEEVNADLLNFQKLAADRLDMVVADKYVGMALINKNLPNMVGKIDTLPKSLQEKDMFVCVSKKIPNGAALVEAFNNGIKELMADGTYIKILAKHGFNQ